MSSQNHYDKVYLYLLTVETFHPHETNELYYVGCKNDILPNTDDHLDEVAVLQRGVEVSFNFY